MMLMIGTASAQSTNLVDPDDCKLETSGWLSMTSSDIRLGSDGEALLGLSVRIADDGPERAAGYQWICPSTARHRVSGSAFDGDWGSAVLFVFPQPFLAAFHMRNVFVPLNIAFFDSDGKVVDVLKMAPEPPGASQRGQYYKAKTQFKYALELPDTKASSRLLSRPGLRLFH